MNSSIILAHPNPESFNHAIAKTVIHALRRNGHHIFYHDLYQESFDPILIHDEISESNRTPEDIWLYCHEIMISDIIIVIHPNWWGQPPAILKGWVDRIFRPGITYRFLEQDDGSGVPFGLLKAKKALVFNTSNTPKDREFKVFGDPLETLWKNCIFGLCGIRNVQRITFQVVISSTQKQREQWLKQVHTIVNELKGG